MADVTVTQFAEVLHIPVDKLLVQLGPGRHHASVARPTRSATTPRCELLTHLRTQPRRRCRRRLRAVASITLQAQVAERDQAGQRAGPCAHRERGSARQAHLREARRARGTGRAPAGTDGRPAARSPRSRSRAAPGEGRGRAARARAHRAGEPPARRGRGGVAARGRRGAQARRAEGSRGSRACAARLRTEPQARGCAGAHRRPRRRQAEQGSPAPASLPMPAPSTAARNCTSPATSVRAHKKKKKFEVRAPRRRTEASRSTASRCPPRRCSARCRWARPSRWPSWRRRWPSRPPKSSRP